MAQSRITCFSKLHKIKLLPFLILLGLSCNRFGEKAENNVDTKGNRIVSVAEKFKIDVHKNYTILTILNPWQGAENINQIFYLVKRGTELPEGIDSANKIIVPIRKIICMSTTHVAMISALNEENTIKGMSGNGLIYSATLRKKIEEELIADVGYEGNLNKELILDLDPDLLMIYGISTLR